MRILAIDTSTSRLSVAVIDESQVVGVRSRDSLGSHTRWLVPTIHELLDTLNLKKEDLTGLALSIGPGSFTGLRAGLASMTGFRLALDIPLVTVPTLEAMAWNVRDSSTLLCPMLRARGKEIYWACFRWKMGKLIRVTEDQVGSIKDVIQTLQEPALGFGEGWTLNQEDFLNQSKLLHSAPVGSHGAFAENIGLASVERFRRGDIAKVGDTPRYILPSYAEGTQVKSPIE